MVGRPSLGLFGFGLWTICVLSMPAPAPASQSSLVVRWAGERLAVSARNVPLAEVLHEVARKTGVQFVGTEPLTEPFSIEFTDKSLDDGLSELLAELNYLMVLPRSGVSPSAPPLRIFVARATKPRSAVPEPPEGVANKEVEPTESVIVESDEFDDPRDPELRRLEESGFFDDANTSALIDAGHHPNAAVRIRALEVLSQRDASLSADLVGDALTDANPSVSSAAAALMAENADLRAVERLGALLKHEDPVVRFGAIQLLAQRQDTASLPYVLQVTNDENAAVRIVARQLADQLETIHSRQ